MGWQRGDAGVGIGVPDLDCAVPRGREERVFGDEVPVHGEDFARVLLPGGNGVRGHVDVEELDGAVAAGGEELVLMRFGPSAVEERVLGVEPWAWLACERRPCTRTWLGTKDVYKEGIHNTPFLSNDAVSGKAENVQPSVSHQPKVCGRCDGDARVEERAVLHRVAVEPLGPELEHGGGVSRRSEGKLDTRETMARRECAEYGAPLRVEKRSRGRAAAWFADDDGVGNGRGASVAGYGGAESGAAWLCSRDRALRFIFGCVSAFAKATGRYLCHDMLLHHECTALRFERPTWMPL